MTSVLNVDTIADKAGTGPVALTKQSAAKLYSQVDQTTSSQTIRKSFNLSTITDSGTGFTTYNITSAMDGIYYSVTASGGNVNASNNWIDRIILFTKISGTYKVPPTATSFTTVVTKTSGSNDDYEHLCNDVHGDLA